MLDRVSSSPSGALNARDALTVARIVRVNHAGEYGAIRIYRAQIRVAHRLFPDVVPVLEEMLRHEVRHCDLFRAAMPARNSRPCRVMSLWSMGGSVLGFMTALMGRQSLWICTAAVEETVHQHLEEQLHFLAHRDPELHATILDIREEELSHLNHAEAQLSGSSLYRRVMRRAIAIVTDVLIWLSTWGDSSRMKAALRAAL